MLDFSTISFKNLDLNREKKVAFSKNKTNLTFKVNTLDTDDRGGAHHHNKNKVVLIY